MATATDWQNLLLLEVGAGLEGKDELDLLSPIISTVWGMWSDMAGVSPRLQYLYAKRQAIDILLGQLRAKTQFSLGPLSVSQQQKFANLQTLRDNTQAEIVRVEKQAAASRGPAIGDLLQTAPIMNNPLLGEMVDPNDRLYRGDPLRPMSPDTIGAVQTGG